MALPSLAQILGTVIISLAAYAITKIVYNLYFHPLAKYPGPKLAAITDIWYARSFMGGRWVFVCQEAHKKYGPIVRVAPNDLSFATVASYKDIYGHTNKDRRTFVKSDFYQRKDQAPSIATERDVEKHAAVRRSLSYAFSPKALRDQTAVVVQYIDLFIQRLGEHAVDEPVNIVEWYNWLTFDIIGDLSFGKSFDALYNAKSHTWINIMLNSAYLGFLGTIWRRLPWLKIIIPWILPPNAVENRKTHIKLCTERARSRLKAKNDRDDFFGHLIAKNANNVTEGFLASQAVSLIIGGSETTATALAGITYNILTNREILDKLTAEVRSAFNSATEITGDSAAKLPYLSAVIEEGLRIFPPVAVGLPRTSPGALVDGHYIPAGVTVFTPTYVMHHDARFWRNPEDFIPERWIPGNGYDNDNHDAFKPMSLGPRNCIGQSLAYIELRIAVARLVYHYDLQLCNGADIDWKRDVRSMALWKMPQVMVRVKSANRA